MSWYASANAFIDNVQVIAYATDRLVLFVLGKRYFYSVDGTGYGPMIERLKKSPNKKDAGAQVSRIINNLSAFLQSDAKTASAASPINIKLSPVEDKIFSLLVSVNQKYKLGLTFRVAGGWVRDKVLGKESDDIDVALDKMTGAQFGQYLQKEVGKRGNVIKANPEQSKHLETMTINLFGQDVDFVNLRSESYGDSRIPEMAFGTPEVDAYRRDLTINALFYNINNGQVEDFTGHGISDLGIGGQPLTLRTPLEPTQTFTDDPLRILRLLRFLSRYKGSQVDPAALEAMKQPSVQQALKQKVSPERVYTEFNKLFKGEQQSQALRMLHDTGLWNVMFGDQMKGFHPFTMDQKNQWHVDNVFEHTLKVVEGYDEILRADGAGDDERARLLCAAFLHDLGKLDPSIIGVKETTEGIFNTYHGHEDVSAQVTQAILEGLKASNAEIQEISTVVRNHMIPHNEMSDKQLRKMIRELGRSLVIRIIQHAKADALSKPGGDVQHYDRLVGRARQIEQLENKKPVLGGDVIMRLFPNISPSTGYMREINTHLQDMKDGNPNLTQEQYIAAIEQMRPQIEQKYQNFVPQKRQKNAEKWLDKAKG